MTQLLTRKIVGVYGVLSVVALLLYVAGYGQTAAVIGIGIVVGLAGRWAVLR